MYKVKINEDRTVSYPVHPYKITLADLQCDFIGSKLATHSVTELYVNKTFMYVSPSSSFGLYTKEDFNIYLSTDKTINRNSDVIREL